MGILKRKKAKNLNKTTDLKKQDEVLETQSSESALKKVSKVFNTPWKIIKVSGSAGIKGAKRLVSVFVIYLLTNIFLFLFTLERLVVSSFKFTNILVVFFVLILGIGITIFVTRKAYRFLIKDTIRVLHSNLTLVFQNASVSIIDRVESLSQGKIDLNTLDVSKAMDFGTMVNNRYKMLPKFLRNGIVQVLNQIPYTGMVMDLQQEIANGNKQLATQQLYGKMDNYIEHNMTKDQNANWIWWLLPCNILFVVIMVFVTIG